MVTFSAPKARIAGVALTAISALALTACGPTPVVSTSPSVATTPVTSPSGTAPLISATPTPAMSAVRVFFVRDAARGVRLVSEPHDVTSAATARAALEAMIAGPDDPDYASPWPKTTRVLDISVSDKVITVNLSADARTAQAGAELTEVMVQQLVYTTTEALGRDATVMLNTGGKPAGDSLGHVVWDAPRGRGAPLGLLQNVSIDEPRQGRAYGSPVPVSGIAAVYEAVLPWRVLDASGAVVAQSQAHTAEGQTFSPYAFSVPLRPGTYTVEVREDDPSDGASGKIDSDTRTFTVS